MNELEHLQNWLSVRVDATELRIKLLIFRVRIEQSNKAYGESQVFVKNLWSFMSIHLIQLLDRIYSRAAAPVVIIRAKCPSEHGYKN